MKKVDTHGGMFVENGITMYGGNQAGRDLNIYESASSPSAATAQSPPPNFVGRTTELDQLTQHLIAGHSAAITAIKGMGGIGKTALAQKLAEHLHEQQPKPFAGGIFWADLDFHSGSAEPILRAWGAFCGADLSREPDVKVLAERVKGLLGQHQNAQGPLLAVLDDVRPGWEENARLLRRSLPPGTPLLITTREQSMTDALDAHIIPLDLLPTADGAKLLADIAQQPALLQDEQQVQRLLDLCGNLPLAIKLAAKYIRSQANRPSFTLAHFADQLQDQALQLLDTRQAERGLAATFAISYGALTPLQQMFFCLATVYSPATLTLENIAGLLALESPEFASEINLEDELHLLVDMALLTWDKADSGGCILHPLLRQYGYARLDEHVDDIRQLHEVAAKFLQDKLGENEINPDEMLEAVDQWGKAEAWETMAHEANALVGSLDHQGYWPEIDLRLANALQGLNELADDETITLQSHLIGNRGSMAYRRSEWDKAITYYQQSLETFEQANDSHGIAQAHGNLGNVYQAKGEWYKAITYYQQSLAIFEQVSDSHGTVSTYNNLGLVYQAKGEWGKAITYYEQSLAKVGDSYGMAITYNNLSLVYRAEGKWDKAIAYYLQSLETFEQVGDSYGMALTYNNLGLVYADKGEWDKAIGYYEQSLTTKEQMGDSHGMAITYNNQGNIYAAKGEWDKAIAYYQQSLKTSVKMGDSHGMALIYNNLGNVCEAKGEWYKAIIYYQQSLIIDEQMGNSHSMAITYNNLGNVYQAEAEWDKAITYYLQSLATFEQVGDRIRLTKTRNNLNSLYQAKEKQETAMQDSFWVQLKQRLFFWR